MNNGAAPSPGLRPEDAAMSNHPLYEKLCDYRILRISYGQALKGKRKYRKEAIVFDMARERNLVELWRMLKNETYRPGEYIQFEVTEPKRRRVSAPRIRDKIIQFAVHLVLWDIYEPVFIKDTFACLDERGTHRAVDRVQHYMRQCKWQHGDCWIIKGDVRKFFYRIDRELLKKLLRKKIKDEKFIRLLDLILDSSPEGDTGIPLGNVTSQDFANIYLNELDQFVKRRLGIKFYVRYMDDFIIMLPSKQEAQRILAEVDAFVQTHMRLELNEKTSIFPVEQGVNAYGFKIYTTHTLARNASKAAAKRRIKAMDRKYRAGEVPLKDVVQSVNSWLGHARHSNSFNLATKIYAPYDYITVKHKKYRFGVKPVTH
ncbi:reverse transcriptase/maturase family protein [Oscillospiraceae bacterium OttesenSCG-928-F05]|nr:reverse transcriptase/maturase family protein [Oscillospiraceae bacterium OttesenSCG-928-F05]